jgi:hypothetical protein
MENHKKITQFTNVKNKTFSPITETPKKPASLKLLKSSPGSAL